MGLAAALALPASFTVKAGTHAYYIPGTTCMAANLDQAFDLSWDHFRVLNPISNSFLRWVVCPLPHFYDSAHGGYNTQSWMATYHEAPGDIWCILRAYPDSQTTAAAPFQTQTISRAGPYPSAGRTTFAAAEVHGFYATKTMTCRLSPGTGINQLTGWGSG